ncbi:MAG: hypothetical protein ABSB74_10090 [Tepidisphaeraceae bacterium]
MELTTKQFAAKLGVSHQRVRQMIDEKKIKARLVTPRLLLIESHELTKVKHRPTGRPAKAKVKHGINRK